MLDCFSLPRFDNLARPPYHTASKVNRLPACTLSSNRSREINTMKKVAAILTLVVAALAGLLWLGFRIPPRRFDPFPGGAVAFETVPLPDGLPAPVERYYRQLYGDEIPVITSAVISGRARMRPAGPFYLPARFRFTHDAGQGYRHYIEVTFFGFPIMKINERFLDGEGIMEIPMAGAFQGPKINQGGNLGLWSENIYMPSVWLTDPRVRWEAVDDETALLVVPFGEEEEQFVVRFDPASGRLRQMETLRYKGEESTEKTLWIPTVLPGETITAAGAALDANATLTWQDEGSPWAILTVEEIVYNADVDEYIRARGE